MRPDRKVTAGALAGSLSAILVWTLNTYVTVERPIPAEIAVAVTTVLTFMVSYFVPNKVG